MNTHCAHNPRPIFRSNLNPFRRPRPPACSALGLLLALVLPSQCPAAAATNDSALPRKEQIAKLTGILKSEAPQKEKADACRELARIGTPAAIAPLAALLGDEKLSHMARYGLETISGSAADAALREALTKLEGRPLVGVIGSIGVRRDVKAVNGLAHRLQDATPDVSQAAARALGSIGTTAAGKELMAALPKAATINQVALCEGLFRCAEALTAHGQRKEAISIYDHLRELPGPHQVRTAALRGAILLREKEGLPLLLETLHSSDFAVFSEGARISQEMPGGDATVALTHELEKAPAERQILLIWTLGKRGDPQAVPALLSAATKCEKPVRLAALQALPELGDNSVIPVLLEMLGDSDPELAQAARESLASLPGRLADLAVLGLVRSSNDARRATGMELLVRRRMTSALPELIKTAGDSNPQVRLLAIKQLGELAGPAQMPELLDLLVKARNPQDLDAAERAVSAVGVMAPNPEAVAGSIAARFAEVQIPQKCALLRVLGAIGGAKALSLVSEAVRLPAPEVHATAIRTLAAWNSVDAAPTLLELAQSSRDPTDRTLCLRSFLSLAGHADVPADRRLVMCRQAARLVQRDDDKKLLLADLGGIPSAESLALAQGYLDEPALKDEAGNAVLGIADKILQGSDAAKLAPKLIGSLEKLAQSSSNESVVKRAKSLLERCRSKT